MQFHHAIVGSLSPDILITSPLHLCNLYVKELFSGNLQGNHINQ